MQGGGGLAAEVVQYDSVFPIDGFLRPGTQVRRFGHKLNALDVFFLYKFNAKL